MACLIKSKNKQLLDSYTDILGSENAAYYVLSKNNVYSLEFTPTGEKSNLFELLLAKNNYNYEEAIKEKSEMYYSSFYNEIGGDWTVTALDSSVVDEKGEPLIDYKPETIDFSDIFDQQITITQEDVMSFNEIQKNLIENDLDRYLKNSVIDNVFEKHSKKTEWLAKKLKKLVDSINKDIITAYSLEKRIDENGNVYFVSKDKNPDGKYKLIILFCEYIENGKKGVYDQTGRLEAAANVIQISLTDGDIATINHELAHHYVRMFWDSKIIQDAVKKLDDGDRSEGWQVRLEEKLVDEITKRTSPSETFWDELKTYVSQAFLWLTSPVKLNLLHKVSLAFRLNDLARVIRKEQYILLFINPTVKRVFNSVPNQNIIDFDSTKRNVGLELAVFKFVDDSMKFYRNYFTTPNSILKDEYDEYAEHVKHILSDLSIPDTIFNRIYINVNDAAYDVIQHTPDPTSIDNIASTNIIDLFREIRTIREAAIQQNINDPESLQQLIPNTESIKNLIKDIVRGLHTRVYEYLHTVPKEALSANNVREFINKIESISEYNKKLELFVSDAIIELGQILNKLELLENNDFADLTPQLLMVVWNTVDGFYGPVIDMITNNPDLDIIKLGMLYEFGTKLSQLLLLCGAVRRLAVKANKIISVKETHSFLVGDDQNDTPGVIDDLLTDEQKERFLENFDDHLIFGKLFEDINMLQPYMGLSSRSKSLIIRVARNMILSANAEIRKATLKDAAHIIKLYMQALPEMRKLGLKEIQSVFLELDERGLPTGYFVRRLNWGKFYDSMNKNRDELILETNKQLIAALGQNAPQITYDVYNNPILPPSGNSTVDTIIAMYSDALDEWLCENAERMFLPEYYRTRRQMLSPRTREVMQEIQTRINSIISKAPIKKITLQNGEVQEILATWELSPEDLQNLVQLRLEYSLLGNHYYSDGTKKTLELLLIAEEITRFNEWKANHTSYNQNHDRFNACINEIRAKYGLNSVQEAKFRKLNTSIVVNPDYYEWVLSKCDLTNNPVLNDLRKRRNDLKKLIDEFDKKGIDVEQKRRQQTYWDSLKEIDKLIQEVLEGLSGIPVPEDRRWSTYFDKEPVMYDDNETLLDHMLKQDIREYRNTHPLDTRDDLLLRDELITKYQYTYTWHDVNGEPHTGVSLVSVFVRQVPKGASIKNHILNGKFAPNALIVKYSPLFSDIDENSDMYNTNFNRQDSHLVLPNLNYDNSALWSVIQNNKNIKKLYYALIELMNKNNSVLPSVGDFNYLLPQITGRRLTILRRSGSLKEMCDALKYNFKNEWQLNERDDLDINYEDLNLKIRANGTRINTVPTRYIKRLDHPEFITSDVIGSVIAFTEMANNFVVKTQLASLLEIIKQQLSDREDAGVASAHNQQTTSNIVKQLTNMMDDLLYANITKYGNKNSKFSKNEQRIIKFFEHFLKKGRILMLGYNFTSMSVGFFESYIRGNLEAFLGKDYNLRDLMHGYANFVKYAIPMLRQVGKVDVTNMEVALMLRFGISKSIKESYHGTERNRFIKLLSENINGMFGFTLGDYSNSFFQLSMALSNVRFINNESVPVGFYTKLTLTRAILKSNPSLSYKEAKAQATMLYKESGICLEDAYELNDDGLAVVKLEYQPFVTNILENRVTGKCYQRLAEALGVVPQNDNPGFLQQVLLRPVGTLRSYLWTVIARNWNWAHDLQKRTLDENGKVVKEDDMIDGFVDIDSGNIHIGLHQGLIGWMRMTAQQLPMIQKKATDPKLTDETKELYDYAAKKVCYELLSICVLVGLSTLFKALAKGSDDDDWFYRFGYLTSVRLVNSFITVLDPTASLDVIKNISTLISPLNDIIRCISILSDMLGLSGHSPFDEIQSGSYKGRSRLFRNIMRVTPFGNAYEDLSIPALKSRANWYIQQDPVTWSSIGGIYDQLWDS